MIVELLHHPFLSVLKDRADFFIEGGSREFPADAASFMTMGKMRKSMELNPVIYDQIFMIGVCSG